MTSDTLAILIDGDNASPKIIAGLLAEIANYGTASVRRIYGDWTKPNLNGWKECLLEHSIQPVQQFAYTTGKNATDGAMIIDAMDLLYTGRFSGFCIVSSDSDFARLASRIREQGIPVYGFGERKTPRPFITACDKFIYVDVLGSAPAEQPQTPQAANQDGAGGEKVKPANLAKAVAVPSKIEAEKPSSGQGGAASGKLNAAALSMLRKAVQATSDEEGWANLGPVGSHLAKQSPDFEARNYGFARLSDLADASGILEVKRGTGQNMAILVKLKKR